MGLLYSECNAQNDALYKLSFSFHPIHRELSLGVHKIEADFFLNSQKEFTFKVNI